MFRSWPATLSGSAQPVFGDTTTAAITIPGGTNQPIVVTVTSTTRYQVGDRIIVDPELANQDVLLVQQIVSSTVMNCLSEGGVATHTHLSSAIIQLSIACREWIVQSIAAALVVLGTDNTVTITPGGSAFYELQPATAPAQPNVFRSSQSSDVNGDRTSDAWMIGTSTQKVLVSAKV